MAVIRGVFGGGPVPQSDSAKAEIAARIERAAQLREMLLSARFTREAYGPASQLTYGARPEDLMPTPDEAVSKFGGGKYELYEVMGRNVLEYGSLREGRIDVNESLEMSVLAGVKGDQESEDAAEEIRDMLDANEEREIAYRASGLASERGFSGLELVWGEHTRGRARGLVGPVAMIDRPNDWFAFDYLQRPRFKRDYFPQDPEVVPEFKVAFSRAGSLHSRWGKGYGKDCFPTVWAIDATRKGYAAMMERFGYLPAIVSYPNSWGQNDSRLLRLKLAIEQQWKNAIFVPGEVDKETITFATEATYAAANASGAMRNQYIDKLVAALSMRIQGTMYSSGNQQEGSYARDYVASIDRLFKAPSDAAVKEAMLNRNFIRPVMLVNRPALEPHKWPRVSIDAKFPEDMRLFMELCESAARMEIPIAAATWSERTGIPLAQDGDAVLASPTKAPIVEPAADPEETAVAAMSEPWITVVRPDGSHARFRPDQPMYVKGKGLIRAAKVEAGDVLVDDPARFVRHLRDVRGQA